MNPHFYIPYPPSNNALWRVSGNRVYPTAAYKKWVEEAGWIIKSQKVSKLTGPVVVSYFAHKPDARKRDLGNLIKALDDILQAIGIIENDSLICAYDEFRWAGKGDVVWCKVRKASETEIKDALL